MRYPQKYHKSIVYFLIKYSENSKNNEPTAHFGFPAFAISCHIYYLMVDDSTTILVLIVDVNPIFWGQKALDERMSGKETPIPFFTKYIEHIIVFLNSYIMMQKKKFAVIASGINRRSYCPGVRFELVLQLLRLSSPGSTVHAK